MSGIGRLVADLSFIHSFIRGRGGLLLLLLLLLPLLLLLLLKRRRGRAEAVVSDAVGVVCRLE